MNTLTKAFVTAVVAIFLFGCDEPARNKPKIIEKGNDKVTSSYGGCQFKEECWDYKGANYQKLFRDKSLQRNCELDKGQFVTNGCSYNNLLASCVRKKGTGEETVVHAYKNSSIDATEFAENCTMQKGEITVFE